MHKLNLAAFHPIIAKVDKRLAGWKAQVLSMAGWVILIRAVIRALPSYIMAVMMLPTGTILEIDKRCHAFFWTGEDQANSGQCKVTWTEVCAPFLKRGLGFRCLRTHNICLLLKSLNKIHSLGSSPWELWFAKQYGWEGGNYLGDSGHLHTPT